MAVRELPVGRYSSPKPKGRRRWVYWSLLGAFILAGLVVAYVGYENLGATPIDPEVSSYQVVGDQQIDFGYTVNRDHPGQAADCIAYALAADGSEVARSELYIPPSETTIQLSGQLRTVKRATTVEFYGCSYQVPTYLTKSMPPSG
ncbi:MAG TPA: DUF4307 domain-containing protein [Pseudonocardiaceae bacterium]|jgi:hypothetical protein|nr:DUF4307 domain-containing protein [Pseudonocardiaceae bacterium]